METLKIFLHLFFLVIIRANVITSEFTRDWINRTDPKTLDNKDPVSDVHIEDSSLSDPSGELDSTGSEEMREIIENPIIEELRDYENSFDLQKPNHSEDNEPSEKTVEEVTTITAFKKLNTDLVDNVTKTNDSATNMELNAGNFENFSKMTESGIQLEHTTVGVANFDKKKDGKANLELIELNTKSVENSKIKDVGANLPPNTERVENVTKMEDNEANLELNVGNFVTTEDITIFNKIKDDLKKDPEELSYKLNTESFVDVSEIKENMVTEPFEDMEEALKEASTDNKTQIGGSGLATDAGYPITSRKEDGNLDQVTELVERDLLKKDLEEVSSTENIQIEGRGLVSNNEKTITENILNTSQIIDEDEGHITKQTRNKPRESENEKKIDEQEFFNTEGSYKNIANPVTTKNTETDEQEIIEQYGGINFSRDEFQETSTVDNMTNEKEQNREQLTHELINDGFENTDGVKNVENGELVTEDFGLKKSFVKKIAESTTMGTIGIEDVNSTEIVETNSSDFEQNRDTDISSTIEELTEEKTESFLESSTESKHQKFDKAVFDSEKSYETDTATVKILEELNISIENNLSPGQITIAGDDTTQITGALFDEKDTHFPNYVDSFDEGVGEFTATDIPVDVYKTTDATNDKKRTVGTVLPKEPEGSSQQIHGDVPKLPKFRGRKFPVDNSFENTNNEPESKDIVDITTIDPLGQNITQATDNLALTTTMDLFTENITQATTKKPKSIFIERVEDSNYIFPGDRTFFFYPNLRKIPSEKDSPNNVTQTPVTRTKATRKTREPSTWMMFSTTPKTTTIMTQKFTTKITTTTKEPPGVASYDLDKLNPKRKPPPVYNFQHYPAETSPQDAAIKDLLKFIIGCKANNSDRAQDVNCSTNKKSLSIYENELYKLSGDKHYNASLEDKMNI